MDLFIQSDVTFEKVGAEVTLPEDPNAWPNEITQELFKQIPYIADFQPHVVMDRADAERGFGFGHVEVMNKTEIQQGASAEGLASAGIKQVRVPVIIRDRKLQPFDVIVTEDSTMLPLTEARLRQAIFRPGNFDITARTPGDMSMIGQLFPPYRQNYGMGGGGAGMSVGMGKEGADTFKPRTLDPTKLSPKTVPGQPFKPSPLKPNRVERLIEKAEPYGKALGALGATAGAAYLGHHFWKKHKEKSSVGMGKEGASKTAVSNKWVRDKVTAAATKAPRARVRDFAERMVSVRDSAHAPGLGHWGKIDDAALAAENALLRKKHSSVLQAILPTINERDYGLFFDELGDQGLQAAFMKNAFATGSALQTLAAFEPASDEKTAAEMLDHIKPTVLQLVREENGYTVKTANHRAWAIRKEAWDRATAVRTLGEKIVLAADLSGSATMTTGEGAPPEPEEEMQAGPIKDFGVYQVRSEDGEELTGHVFPNLIDIDGTALPLALFWNGEKAAVQGDIVGTKVGDETPMVEGQPEGRGSFYDISGEEPIATIPLTIRSTLSGAEEGGVTLMAETFDGREVSVLIQPNIAGVMLGEEGHMLVPDTMKWLPLDDCQDVALVSGAEEAEKMAHPTRAFATVLIRSGGAESFSIDGMPVEKIAREDRSFLATDDALFLLTGLGMHPDHAIKKLADAYTGHAPIEARVGHVIRPAHEAFEAATKFTSERVANVPDLRVSLVKEAAVIPDPTAVDTVLSLGFINPDNMQTFIAYLPEIEEAQKKMCELLIASRLGLQEIPSAALEKAVRSTEQVLEGLKVLAFQQN